MTIFLPPYIYTYHESTENIRCAKKRKACRGIPWEARSSALERRGAGLEGHFFSRSSTLSMWSATVAGLMLLRQA